MIKQYRKFSLGCRIEQNNEGIFIYHFDIWHIFIPSSLRYSCYTNKQSSFNLRRVHQRLFSFFVSSENICLQDCTPPYTFRPQSFLFLRTTYSIFSHEIMVEIVFFQCFDIIDKKHVNYISTIWNNKSILCPTANTTSNTIFVLTQSWYAVKWGVCRRWK